MNTEIFAALRQLEKERGIPVDYMVERITQALVAAYKKDKDGYTDNVFVEHRVDRARDRLAVVDVHAAVLVDVQAQEPFAALADVFDVPKLAALLLHQRLGKLPNLFRDLQIASSFCGLGRSRLFKKKETGEPVSLVVLLSDCLYYSIQIPEMQAFFAAFLAVFSISEKNLFNFFEKTAAPLCYFAGYYDIMAAAP